jgi:hypothetical protein
MIGTLCHLGKYNHNLEDCTVHLLGGIFSMNRFRTYCRATLP